MKGNNRKRMKANEAPEKIYVHEASAPELTEKLPYHIEYVRKDTLLEWAKIKQTQCLENSTAHVYFQIFIDKINCI